MENPTTVSHHLGWRQKHHLNTAYSIHVLSGFISVLVCHLSALDICQLLSHSISCAKHFPVPLSLVNFCLSFRSQFTCWFSLGKLFLTVHIQELLILSTLMAPSTFLQSVPVLFVFVFYTGSLSHSTINTRRAENMSVLVTVIVSMPSKITGKWWYSCLCIC